MKNLIFFQKKCIFFLQAQKNLPNSGELERKNNIKIMKKTCFLFHGHPSIERGQFVKLLFGIRFGAALQLVAVG